LLTFLILIAQKRKVILIYNNIHLSKWMEKTNTSTKLLNVFQIYVGKMSKLT
jgi:hypothetical protein